MKPRLFFLILVIVSSTPMLAAQKTDSCESGKAMQRTVLPKDHIAVYIYIMDPEETGIAAIWKRLLSRITDVTIVDTDTKADLLIIGVARPIKTKAGETTLLVWETDVSAPWRVLCDSGDATRILQGMPAGGTPVFLNFAPDETDAARVIQGSVNTVEDTTIQPLRTRKRN